MRCIRVEKAVMRDKKKQVMIMGRKGWERVVRCGGGVVKEN